MRLIDADALIKNTIFNPHHAPYIVKQDVDNAPTIPLWKEGMPEYEGDYLVTDGHKVPWKCRMIKLGGVKGWVNSVSNPAVKYWMPYPELPKEDTGNGNC